MSSSGAELVFPAPAGSGEGAEWTVSSVKARQGTWLSQGQLVALADPAPGAPAKAAVVRVKAERPARVTRVHVQKGDVVNRRSVLLSLSYECKHPTVMKDLCADCGYDLRKDESITSSAMASSSQATRAQHANQTARFSMVHSIPELKVSNDEAQNLGKEDELRLLKHRKLVLLVDLDQTLIHTTHENIAPNLKDVHHFQLNGPKSPWYHTRIRPGTAAFLESISQLYELHIVTFGARMYAHAIAAILDKDTKHFSHRILSRDECFDSRRKTANLSSLFPCGDHMVCIIDDREDVWNYAPNLVHVKPYNFFQDTGDINAPPSAASQGSKASDKAEDQAKKKPSEVKEGEEKSSEAKEGEKKSSEAKDGEEKKPAEPKKEKKKFSESKKSEEKPEEEAKDAQDTKKKDPASSVGDDLSLSDDEDKSDNSDKIDEGEDDDDQQEASLGEKEKAAAPGGPSAKDGDLIDVEDSDDYLLYLEDILKTIHKAYYDLYDQMRAEHAKEEAPSRCSVPNLKTVIPYVKRKTLQGSNLVFSGVVPTHVPLRKSKAARVAKSLGANVTETIVKAAGESEHDEQSRTTHLVAARLGTAKVNEARRVPELHIVTPDWLWCCAERWDRADEKLFPLSKQVQATLKPPAHCSSPDIAYAERCAQASEDAFKESCKNPLISLSSDDIKSLEKEVDDCLSEDSSSSDEGETSTTSGAGKRKRALGIEPGQEDSSSSDAESLDGDVPKGWEKKENSYRSSNKRSRLEDDDDDSSSSEDDDEEDDDALALLGEVLEKEILVDQDPDEDDEELD